MRRDSHWAADDVRLFMTEHKIGSAGELAQLIGLNRKTVYQILNGSTVVTTTVALAMVGLSAMLSGNAYRRAGRRK